ncbi:sigma-70 family RNA polymerase sigma factor [Clostridium sp. CCUG 7971]|uniref:sigma-70 family RNA polymerase sigma factor n=1 Tax=Clostridium sp. CCUG 7971 TaxID=2811414 RepID=UPI001ABBC057|nr:sigma-70 family RNA polymerase sigma factor [Clostridium sp. CCUG 7971]MBO3446120.1 sigma-70 family RNA polymerase sigma factor [Clostridium sp. CCUG 7971]
MGQLLPLKKIKKRDRSSEKNIIEKAIDGDKDAIEILINEHKEYLYKTAFLYTKNEHDAMDICQETVYKAIMNIHKLKNPSYFKTWLTRILINNVNDRNRSKSRMFDNIDKLEYIEDISYEKLEENIDLYNAIDILDEKFKTPIILQYFQDMTVKEIAQILECNENTIKTYLRRGREKLYKILMEGK